MDILDLIIKTIEATIGRKLKESERSQVEFEFKGTILAIDKAIITEVNDFVKRRRLI